MRVPLKADYALRALLELATADEGEWVKADRVASSQNISTAFLLNIFVELKRARIVRSQRGKDGGFQLGRPASEITCGDVLRAVDGPLASVGDNRPDELDYDGPAASLQDVWVAVRVNLREVLDVVTLADIASGQLPKHIADLTKADDAWEPR